MQRQNKRRGPYTHLTSLVLAASLTQVSFFSVSASAKNSAKKKKIVEISFAKEPQNQTKIPHSKKPAKKFVIAKNTAKDSDQAFLDSQTVAVKAAQSDVRESQPSTTPITTLHEKLEEKQKTQDKNKDGYSLNAGYSFRTDYAQDLKPRLWQHHISFGGAYSFQKTWSMAANSGLDYQSLDSAIVADKQENYYSSSDSSVNLGKSLKYQNYKYQVFGDVTFPTSAASRYEGINSILTTGISVPLEFFKGYYDLNNQFTVSRIMNRFEYSPSRFNENTNWITNYEISNGFKIYQSWKVGLDLNVTSSQTVFGKWSVDSGFALWTGYSWKYLSAGIRYLQGDSRSPRDREDTLWYLDSHKQILLFSIGLNLNI